METDTLTRSRKRHPRAPQVAATVTVTAIAVNGTDIECDVSGPNVTDNAIFVDDTADTTLTFNLVDHTGQNVQFDTSNPFANQRSRCPKAPGGPKPPCSLDNPPAPTATSFTINVEPTNGKAVTYYRLNFTNGSWDPIIIHD